MRFQSSSFVAEDKSDRAARAHILIHLMASLRSVGMARDWGFKGIGGTATAAKRYYMTRSQVAAARMVTTLRDCDVAPRLELRTSATARP